MPIVLGFASVLGVSGVVASFGFSISAKAFSILTVSQIQTLMYLKLSIAGHLTIFVTRTRPVLVHSPARVLLLAVCGTQLVATLIAVYGLFMTPLGWRWAVGMGVCLAWFVVDDRLKLLAYRILIPQPQNTLHL